MTKSSDKNNRTAKRGHADVSTSSDLELTNAVRKNRRIMSWLSLLQTQQNRLVNMLLSTVEAVEARNDGTYEELTDTERLEGKSTKEVVMVLNVPIMKDFFSKVFGVDLVLFNFILKKLKEHERSKQSVSEKKITLQEQLMLTLQVCHEGSVSGVVDKYEKVDEYMLYVIMDNIFACTLDSVYMFFNRMPTSDELQSIHDQYVGRKLPGCCGNFECRRVSWKAVQDRVQGGAKVDHYHSEVIYNSEVWTDSKGYCWSWNAVLNKSKQNTEMLSESVLLSKLFKEKFHLLHKSGYKIVPNGIRRHLMYFIVDETYPRWPIFVKSSKNNTRQHSSERFINNYRNVRKEGNEFFAKLQKKWGVLRQENRFLPLSTIMKVGQFCVTMNNISVRLNELKIDPEMELDDVDVESMFRFEKRRYELQIMERSEITERTSINSEDDDEIGKMRANLQSQLTNMEEHDSLMKELIKLHELNN